jgi:hypothetical protein
LLSDEDLQELEFVTHQAELMKYNHSLIGSNLLLEITDRMQNGEDVFYLYSAHYPTLLGLFAAMGVAPVESKALPEYATAMIFELWVNGTERRFQIIYKPGDAGVNETIVSLGACSYTDMCPMNLLVYISSDYSVEKWCEKCMSSTADVCLVQLAASAGTSAENCPTSPTVISSTLSLLVGVLAGTLGMMLLMYVQRRKRRQGAEDHEKTERDVPSPSSSYA